MEFEMDGGRRRGGGEIAIRSRRVENRVGEKRRGLEEGEELASFKGRRKHDVALGSGSHEIGRSNVKRINFVGIPPWRKQSRDYHDRIAMVAKRMHGPGCILPFPLLWNRDFTSTANLVTQSRKSVTRFSLCNVLSQSFSQFSLINAQRTIRNPIGHQTRSRKSPWLIQKWPTVTNSRR
ncbi:hypothetical protein V1478_002975 [Vespula squamosa]|uniref:Uncharacterized protein n=1 Tax=Vespula squamosa TaxID=30214 RepID=A0ABD2BRC9_VESSQ